MQTYLVYGNAKNTYQSTVFTKPDVQTVIAGDMARLTLADGTLLEGALLSANDESTSQWPAHVSVLVSETEPGDVLTRLLQEQGWDVVERAPRGVTVPFSVDALLLTAASTDTPTYFSTLWADKGFAPLQRTTIHAPGGHDLDVQVLDYFTAESGRPQLVAVAEPATIPDTPFTPVDGWNGPVPGLGADEWGERLLLARALQTQVEHLLGTPVVVGVTVADAEALNLLTPAMVADLPEDIRYEAREPLTQAGRPDLAAACQG